MFESTLYRISPLWLQQWMVLARSALRAALRGQAGDMLSADLERTQWLSRAELDSLVLHRTRNVLERAGERVPHYRDLFKEIGFDPYALNRIEAIQRLPVLTKKEVVSLGARLFDETHRGLTFSGFTSGTTGTAMRGVRDLKAIRFEAAFVSRQLRWAGYVAGKRRIWLRGDPIVPFRQRKAPFWRFDRTENMLMMSSYHLSESTAHEYIRAIEEFDPVLIQAYPSSISFLARFLDASDRLYTGNNLTGIVTSSEPLSAEQRRLMSHRFRTRVFDWYGSFERVAAIGTCEYGNYHVIEDYGLTEFDPQPDGSSEIVATGFGNALMPLIRYRSVDSVILADPAYECPCRRVFRVVERINGRLDDVIRTRDGRLHVMPDFIFHGIDPLLEAQFVQERLDELRILVVARDDFSVGHAELLRKRAQERLGPFKDVYVERVSMIPRTASGKFRGVVCKV